MKIGVAVPGRLHGFALARALLDRGHEVTVLTNYPRWGAARFGVPRAAVKSFWLQGVLNRLASRAARIAPSFYPEALLHEVFGRWVARKVQRDSWDVVYLFSGIAEETLQAMAGRRSLLLLARGSAHIRTQARLLEEEERRTGVPQDRPSPWMIAREEREYRLADRVVVPSKFAYRSFVEGGVLPEKLATLPLGVRVDSFRPPPDVVEARCGRIASAEPLRVLYVGALSFRKGLWDLAEVTRRLFGRGFRFQFVGPLLGEATALLPQLRAHAALTPKRPESELRASYDWGDVFLFPTIEDGFAQVLAQAAASALPILTTTNCSGPDFIRDGENGWVVPIRSPDRLVDRLLWCDSHRPALADMVRQIYHHFQPREWTELAADFESLCDWALKHRSHSGEQGEPREISAKRGSR
jgi:glycosyltransferase involved in cell wall biosynthesis